MSSQLEKSIFLCGFQSSAAECRCLKTYFMAQCIGLCSPLDSDLACTRHSLRVPCILPVFTACPVWFLPSLLYVLTHQLQNSCDHWILERFISKRTIPTSQAKLLPMPGQVGNYTKGSPAALHVEHLLNALHAACILLPLIINVSCKQYVACINY